jgi:hypothetical protein
VIADVTAVAISLVATLGLWGQWRGGLADVLQPDSNVAFAYVYAPSNTGVTLLLSVGLLFERAWIPERLFFVFAAVIGSFTLLGLVYALVTILTRWKRLLPQWHRDRLRGLEAATLVRATPVGGWAPPPGDRPTATGLGEVTGRWTVNPGGQAPEAGGPEPPGSEPPRSEPPGSEPPGSEPPGSGAPGAEPPGPAAAEVAALEHGRQLRAARRVHRTTRRRRTRDR